jgi:hypothetical protein
MYVPHGLLGGHYPSFHLHTSRRMALPYGYLCSVLSCHRVSRVSTALLLVVTPAGDNAW